MVFNWALFFAAIPRTSIGVATVVFPVQPLRVIAIGAWWLREPVSRLQWTAVLVSLAGLVLATGLRDAPQPGLVMTQSYRWGLLLCLGGSLSFAAVTLIAKSAHTVSPFALAWCQCLVGWAVYGRTLSAVELAAVGLILLALWVVRRPANLALPESPRA